MGPAVTFGRPLDGETMNLVFIWRIGAEVVAELESGNLSPVRAHNSPLLLPLPVVVVQLLLAVAVPVRLRG